MRVKSAPRPSSPAPNRTAGLPAKTLETNFGNVLLDGALGVKEKEFHLSIQEVTLLPWVAAPSPRNQIFKSETTGSVSYSVNKKLFQFPELTRVR